MNKYFKNTIIIICVFLTLLTLCSTKCRRDKDCHRTITVVNKSDSVITICERLHNIDENYWVLIKINNINPMDAFEYSSLTRHQCYEEELLNAPNAFFSSVYVLSNTYNYIKTSTYDSLFIVYDVLKYIDLAELGPDSLSLTDFTVYYP